MLFMVTGWGGEAVTDFIGAWGSFPVSIVICVVLWPSLMDASLSAHRRRAWRLIFVALVLDIIASVGWGYSALTENVTFGSWPDVLYIFYYPLAAWAFVLLYLDLGGRTQHAARADRLHHGGDRLRLAAVVHRTGAGRRHVAPSEVMENWSVVGYGIGDAIAIIAGAMVAMQITDWRAERPIVWLLIAMVVTLVSDLLWINAELRGTYVIGGASDIGYFVFYLCMFAAVRYQLGHRQPIASTLGLQGDLRGSLPIVALMVGTIALLDDRLQLAERPVAVADLGAGRGHAAGGGGPGILHARSGRPASRSRHAPLRRTAHRAGAPLERHDRDLRRRGSHTLCQPLVRAVVRRGARRARRPAPR